MICLIKRVHGLLLRYLNENKKRSVREVRSSSYIDMNGATTQRVNALYSCFHQRCCWSTNSITCLRSCNFIGRLSRTASLHDPFGQFRKEAQIHPRKEQIDHVHEIEKVVLLNLVEENGIVEYIDNLYHNARCPTNKKESGKAKQLYHHASLLLPSEWLLSATLLSKYSCNQNGVC